jgi:DNA-binding CsgD family transcriptional regulator
MGVQESRAEALTEAIYDAAVDPAGWAEVMALVRESFASDVETLYSLDYARRRMRPIEVAGIGQRFLDSFESSFYTDDNPSTRTPALHRPGVVRTDQRLGEYFRDPGILRRSRYFIEWMQPQNLCHTMGMTPLTRDGRVINLSLLRSADAGPFRDAEIARFARLQPHFRRALSMAARLEGATEKGALSAAALDRMAQGVVFADASGRVRHGNAAAEALLHRGVGLSVRGGRLVAADPVAQQQLTALLRGVQEQSICVPRRDGERPLVVSALPVARRRASFVERQAAVMLLIHDPQSPRLPRAELLQSLYRLTPAEARLAQALLAGGGLRRAAATAGMSYETARWYLKVLFQKTHTGRQSDLVARLLADLEGPPAA